MSLVSEFIRFNIQQGSLAVLVSAFDCTRNVHYCVILSEWFSGLNCYFHKDGNTQCTLF